MQSFNEREKLMRKPIKSRAEQWAEAERLKQTESALDSSDLLGRRVIEGDSRETRDDDNAKVIVCASIIVAWQAGELSEMQAVRKLGVDIVTAREMRDDLINTDLRVRLGERPNESRSATGGVRRGSCAAGGKAVEG